MLDMAIPDTNTETTTTTTTASVGSKRTIDQIDYIYIEDDSDSDETKALEAVEYGDHMDGVSNDVTSKDMPTEIDTQLHEKSDHSLGSDSHMKKAHTNNKTRGVFQVFTTALTDENIKAFFSPKYNTPRTKEERKSAPRSSVV